ncbi:hypothetical protein [uncultured Desulfovibrio sp.]|uniref:hypothetical protein n=1 Tax=uncultured Desulfovibrio sp. TaxID=167968 RepID=UPI0026039B18|nr:hypothetical protein [uncultured Desulfovibrio sp.]
MDITWPQEFQDMLAGWQDDPVGARPAFEAYAARLAGLAQVTLSFKARPGVSYSLRARHAAQKTREVFVLVDVVDDDPENRWLSVCFYADMVNDPDERGDFVPGGLMGADACCLTLDEDDGEMRAYIAARLDEAAAAAAEGRE